MIFTKQNVWQNFRARTLVVTRGKFLLCAVALCRICDNSPPRFPALSLVSGSMLGKLLFFLAGTYAGIYLDQRYQLPKADDPKELWAKVQEYASQYKKDSDSKDS